MKQRDSKIKIDIVSEKKVRVREILMFERGRNDE